VTDDLLATFGIYGGTYVVCLLAGLIPLINSEVYLVGLTLWAVHDPLPLAAVVVLASVGQMTAKIILYYAAYGMFELPRGRFHAKILAARSRMEKWRDRPKYVIAISAVVGLPPFYLVSLAAGALKIRLRVFLPIGLIGRIVHFAVVVAIARLW
jgi:membrane protein YqaA with SNARE-associated domain